jgi:tetratricopeptide (TPR) repeat protein
MHSMIAMRTCIIRDVPAMADPLRDQETAGGSSAGRDSRIEELLLAGLDHYFSGQYELAISVWTRVLFLDRNHARARAYIERARGAVAERQREAEELLQTGVAAFHRGDASDARRLLAAAVERGVRPEEPLALLERLDRISPASSAEPVTARRRFLGRPDPQRAHAAGTPAPALFALVLLIGLAAGALLVVYVSGGSLWPAGASKASPAQASRTQEPLPVPSASEVSLARARAWMNSGRLHDALRALDEIRPGDALHGEADALRAEIQQRLLGASRHR